MTPIQPTDDCNGPSRAACPVRRLGGDFPAFYGAGRLVLEGQSQDIWDWGEQSRIQRAYLDTGPEGASILPFPYAPHVALAFASIAWMPYRLAYAVSWVVMFLLVVVSVRGVVRLFPSLRPWTVPILAATLTFMPVFKAASGGQVDAAVLAATVWMFVAWQDDREVLAGVLIGLATFKPQYGLLLLALAVVRGHWRSVVAAAVTTGATYVVGAVMLSVDWPLRWLDATRIVDQGNAVSNLWNSVSLVEILRVSAPAGTVLAIILGVGVSVLAWRRVRGAPDVAVLALVGPWMLIVSPHAYTYGLGLLLPTVAYLLAKLGRPALRPLSAVWLVGAVVPFHTPLSRLGVVILVAVAAWAWTAVGDDGPIALRAA